MDIQGSVALVTGANRGLGRAFTRGLVEAGARTVYGAARAPASVTEPGVTPIGLDITDPAGVAGVAARLGDVNLLINNAGVFHRSAPLADDAIEALRADLETNVFGTLAVSRAFAPILAANGGGAMVTMLSVTSWITPPGFGSYAASKAALWSLTNSLRLELRPRGTLVVGVHAAYIDTDLIAGVSAPKIAPADVVAQVLEAVGAGREEVLADDPTRAVQARLAGGVPALYPLPGRAG